MSATTTHVCQSRRPALIERHPNGVHGIATRRNGQGHLIGWPALYLSGFARGPALLRHTAYQAKPTAAVSRSALRSNGPFGAHVATVVAAANAGCAGQLKTAAAHATVTEVAVLSSGKAVRCFSQGRASCFKRSGCSVDCATARCSSCAESVSTGDVTRPRRWQCESVGQSQGRWMTAQLTLAMRTALMTARTTTLISG
jgi:hypothetical protein